MPWYPGAVRRPIVRNFTDRARSRTRAAVLHVDGGGAASLQGWFNNPAARASSHFHVASSGTIEQYLDSDLIAWTSGEGNTTTVGIETQGTATGAWTPEQVRSITALLVWLCQVYDIPAVAMANSRPATVGIGTHRLGVNGNFPLIGVQRGRLQRGGGETWSSDRGKVCPGDDRQAQWPGIVDAVAAELTPAAVLPVPDSGGLLMSRRIYMSRYQRRELPVNSWRTLPLDSDGNLSATVAPGDFDSLLQLTIQGLPAGRELQVRYILVDYYTDSTPTTIRTAYPITEVIGTSGATFAQIAQKGTVPAPSGKVRPRLRVQVKTFAEGVAITSTQIRTDQK